MRKPLLLIGVLCCLLFSAAAPLTMAKNHVDRWYEHPSLLSKIEIWLIPRIVALPGTEPIAGTNIFNDGPDPVGSEKSDDGDAPEQGADQQNQNNGPIPLGSVGSDELPGARE